MLFGAKTRVYIAGCGGMLGRAVYELFNPLSTVMATDIDLNIDWLSFADVRDYKSVKDSVFEFSRDFLINLAALTDLEYCEANEENAWRTNCVGAENLALLASSLDVPLVHISTAGIVDGKQDSYHDFGRHSPLSVYGKSKYEGELTVQTLAPKHFVCGQVG